MTFEQIASIQVAIKVLEWYRDQALSIAIDTHFAKWEGVVGTVSLLKVDAGNQAACMIEFLEKMAPRNDKNTL